MFILPHLLDPAMLVSMTRDGVVPSHAGRECDDAGALSDGGVIDGVVPCAVATTRDTKPSSLSFAPTPMLVHHSALRLKDIQASSSGETRYVVPVVCLESVCIVRKVSLVSLMCAACTNIKGELKWDPYEQSF